MQPVNDYIYIHFSEAVKSVFLACVQLKHGCLFFFKLRYH